jgi:hypothetical protein
LSRVGTAQPQAAHPGGVDQGAAAPIEADPVGRSTALVTKAASPGT